MIKVLLFAELEEKAGQREIEYDMEEVSVKELRNKVQEDFPNITGMERAMAALNEEYAGEDTPVHKDDLLAFIPPVSGG
ncbi:molybdopterin converting factor subunit 1 [Salisediminibacterium halotolerans]|uniref:Molybdopterin synthase sulfur carrier subunit n=1 Tax=Salisediminibacterium halotolerans TaxID=517425 RepID=A0A1H9VEW1_9BACI|nr:MULTISPECIES: molybdopterin converting factor subunit 1 [Salisediminibacterium]RLJ74455.1 molybdopterin synthase subunit MoaD [Actinophytocola xinjiangensis]RPE87452.1 molybdopterin synthase subunit MoaD [Salisediminibacterium halotolerans]TWG35291.1 molybdopterin synthase subunit MoaD [Salisediminibacterium halotolerans]SES20118.1 molybdopterin synthase sulfur carrier subunit [Salisediminibacterium haloalkalitolerans]GEL06773.1 molybdopterin synthase sulfur carrier subunit [Salisediminibac